MLLRKKNYQDTEKLYVTFEKNLINPQQPSYYVVTQDF